MTQDASSDSSGSWRVASSPDVPRLLIVEDNDDLRRAVSAYFGEHGWHVKATRAYATALTLASDHRPHVIITELMLPDVRGYKFVDTYRRLIPEHRVRVIALTRMSDVLFPRAKESGFDEVLAKPMAFDALRAFAEQR